MSSVVRVVVVDRDPIYRIGVGLALAAANGMLLVGNGATLSDLLALGASLSPDIVLLGAGGDGPMGEEVRRAATAFPLSLVVVMTREEGAGPPQVALDAGASAYLSKCVTGAELVESLRSVASGNRVVSPRLSAGNHPILHPSERIDTLTDRERQVLASVGRGRTNREVADELVLSEKTVKQYMSNIMDKLQVRNRVEAVILARRYKSQAGSD